MTRSGERGPPKVPRRPLDSHGNRTKLLFAGLPPAPHERTPTPEPSLQPYPGRSPSPSGLAACPNPAAVNGAA
jgi:hypothetical protein